MGVRRRRGVSARLASDAAWMTGVKTIVLIGSLLFLPAASRPQSAVPRRDIPSIAKAANGGIVSILMSNNGKDIAQGTGFLISRDGLILTNYHVIAEGTSATVKLPDGSVFPVDGVVSSNKLRDIAVIKTHGKSFQTLTLGNSDQLQIGEEVVAIGNPLSLESTVSNGILSGVRTIQEAGGRFLQITAPISHGSSGGPLFNMAGQVVGITTLFIEGGESLNFAIPINDAKELLSSRTSGLQKFPNETETQETTQDSDFAKSRVVSYSPSTHVVTVLKGNRLFTCKAVAILCDIKPLEQFDSAKDCSKTPSVAGELVGQDLPNMMYVFSKLQGKYEGYYLSEDLDEPNYLTLLEVSHSPHTKFRSESWIIEKVEAVQ